MQLGIALFDGDWQIVNGNLVLANYLLAKIKLILTVQKGSWLYDVNFGSDIPQIPKNRANITLEQLKQLLNDAFNPLIINNEVTDLNIVVTFLQLGAFKMDVHVKDITGNYFKFNYSSMETN